MITAIIAVVLFGFAALAVELTDLYSRDRASQTTADLAALSGAQGLPGVCEAFDRARQTLVQPDNRVRDDLTPGAFTATAAQLRDYSAANPATIDNGEIWVLRRYVEGSVPPFPPADVISTAGCNGSSAAQAEVTTGEARFIKVTTPSSTVDFGLVAALPGSSPDTGSVRASATAGLRSPVIGDIMPVFLPASCNFGANYVITDSPSAGNAPSDRPRYEPPGANGMRQAPVVDSVTSSVVSGGLVQQVTITLSNLAAPPTLGSVKFDFHTGTGGSTVRWPLTDPDGVTALSVTPGPATVAPYTAEYEVQLNNYITSRGGNWFARASELVGPNVPEWTKGDDAKPFTVVAVSSPGCGDPATGNFGLLRGDRDDGNTNAQQLALNFINGLDYDVTSIPVLPPVDTACATNGSPPTSVRSTENPPTDGANCLAIESGGNRGPITSGLVEGASGQPGRLAVQTALPPSSCVEPSGQGDSASTQNTPGNRQWRTPGNPRVSIWNTQLSCYLPSGTALSALQTCDGCLDARIIEDPRYFLVPVLNTAGRPPSSTQWPVKEFRGAFITNEVSGTAATCATELKCNGLEFNTGGQSLFALQVFVFPLSALPDELPVTGDGGAYTGVGPKDFLLID